MEGIICLQSDAKKISVASPTLDLFHKLLEQSRQPAEYMHNSVTWTSLNVQEILTLRIYSPGMPFFTTKVVMQTLQPSLESSVQRNSTMTPLKAANHLWLNENQVHFPLQQLK